MNCEHVTKLEAENKRLKLLIDAYSKALGKLDNYLYTARFANDSADVIEIRKKCLEAGQSITRVVLETSPSKVTWVALTRRTEEPKLTYLRRQLDKAGIENRITGESFHAPILSVPEQCINSAWDVLDPIDKFEDDDPRFT